MPMPTLMPTPMPLPMLTPTVSLFLSLLAGAAANAYAATDAINLIFFWSWSASAWALDENLHFSNFFCFDFFCNFFSLSLLLPPPTIKNSYEIHSFIRLFFAITAALLRYCTHRLLCFADAHVAPYAVLNRRRFFARPSPLV